MTTVAASAATTALPAIIPDIAARRRAFDAEIERRRAATPLSIHDQRRNRRMSMEEINASDPDDLLRRMERVGPADHRGGLERFLDLIDAPRNAIVAYGLAPSLRRKAEAEGRTGAYGVGRVTGADILRDMGVEHRLVRSVLGLGLDLVFDPLMYLGGAGALLRLGGKGANVAVQRAGRRVLEGGIKAAASGQRVADPAARGVIESLAASPEVVQRYIRMAGGGETAVARARGLVAERVLGRVRRPLGRAGRAVGFDAIAPTSPLLDWAGRAVTATTPAREAARTTAAREFLARYGRGSAPGVRIGRGGVEIAGRQPGRIAAGSQILHVPFTDYGLFVPPLTGQAVSNVAGRALAVAGATARAAGESVAPLYPATAATAGHLGRLADETLAIRDKLEGIRRGHVIGDRKALSERLEAIASEADVLASVDPFAPGAAARARGLGNAADVIHEADARDRARALRAYIEAMRESVEAQSTAVARAREALARAMAVERVADPSLSRAEVRKAALQRMDAAARELAVVSSGERLALRTAQTVLARRVQAAQGLADAIHTPLVATLGSEDRDLARLAAHSLGLDYALVGAHGLAPLKHAVEALFHPNSRTAAAISDAIDRSGATIRGNIGGRGGRLPMVQRMLRRADQPRDNPAFAATLTAMVQKIRAAVSNPDEIERASEAVALLMLERLDPQRVVSPNSPAWALLDEIRASGVLSAKIRPDTARALNAIADEQIAALSALGGGRPSVLPHVLTPEARTLVREQARHFPGQLMGPGARAARRKQPTLLAAEEAFEKARSTIFYDLPDGTRVYEWERAVLRQLTPADVRALQPVARARAEQIMPLLDDLDAAIKSGAVVGRHLDPWQINELVRHGHFSMLTGRTAHPPSFRFFVEDAAMMMAQRSAQQYRAEMRDTLQTLAESYALRVNDQHLAAVHRTPGRTVFRTSGGVVARIFTDRRGRTVLEMGGERYRRVTPPLGLAEAYDPAASLYPSKLYQAYLPERVAEIVEAASEPFHTIDSTHGLIRFYDGITKLWRTSTLFHPAWVMTNMVGNAQQAVWATRDPARLLSFAPDAMRLVQAYARGDAEALRRMTLTVAGRTMTGWDIVNGPARQAVFQAASATEMMLHALGNGAVRIGDEPSIWRHPMQAGRRMKENARRAIEASLTAASMHRRPYTDKLRMVKGVVYDEAIMRRFVRPFFHLNERAEQFVRANALLTLLDQGHTIDSATARVVETMFDFTDMTRGESGVLRRFFPFYSWLRNSGFYSLRMLMEDPKYIAMVPHLRDAVEEAVAGEEAVPRHLRPSWMRDQLAVQIGTDPDTRSALLLGTMMVQDVGMRAAAGAAAPLTGGAGFHELVKLVSSSLNPAVNTVVALATQRDPYTGRRLSYEEFEGDMHAREYAMSQFRPMRELGVGTGRAGGLGRAAERGPGHLLGRVAIAGRLVPFSRGYADFQIARERRERIESMLARHRLAQREGRAGEAADVRARIMATYRQMLTQGLGDHVPRWARKQLAGLGATHAP